MPLPQIFFQQSVPNHDLGLKYTVQQESPPAWTQEAYCPPRSNNSFCCHILADPPPAGPDPPLAGLTWPPPNWLDLTPPWLGLTWPSPRLDWPDPPPPPLAGPDPPWLDWPPRLDLTPPVDRQTPVKTVPSRRTTYAGGKNLMNFILQLNLQVTNWESHGHNVSKLISIGPLRKARAQNCYCSAMQQHQNYHHLPSLSQFKHLRLVEMFTAVHTRIYLLVS